MKKYIKTLKIFIKKKIIKKPLKQIIKENKTEIKYSIFLILLNITKNIYFNSDTITLFLNNIYMIDYTYFETLYNIYNNIIDLLPFKLPKIIYPIELPQRDIPIFTESELENKELTKLKEDVSDKRKITNFLICMTISYVCLVIYSVVW